MKVINYFIILACSIEILAGVYLLISGELDTPVFVGIFILILISVTVIMITLERERERRELIKDIEWCESELFIMQEDLDELKSK